MNNYYPISPLAASLLAGGWQIQEAIKFHADPGLEALDDERAIEAAFEGGWNGRDGIDAILDSFLGGKWAVLTALLRGCSAARNGGASRRLAEITLDALKMSRAVNPDFAAAAQAALYVPEASPLISEIRGLARKHLADDDA